VALGLAVVTWRKAGHDLVDRPGARQNTNLLERITAADIIPAESIEYLRRNELNLNLMIEWIHAGPLLLRAPHVRVFLDGRAQQVFTEETYTDYRALFLDPEPDARTVFAVLDGHGSGAARHPSPPTDAVLLTKSPRTKEIWKLLDRNPEWVSVLLTDNSILYCRRDSPWFARIQERIDQGTEWRPESPVAMASRGNLLLARTPPDAEGALQLFRQGLEQDVRLGLNLYPIIVALLRSSGRTGEAEQFLATERARVEGLGEGLDEATRRLLLELLDRLGAGESRG
jgi:hypothetical protein